MEREQVLSALVRFSEPLSALEHSIEGLSWDSTEELMTLTAQHVRSVLDRFLDQELSAQDVERWANLLECREDIAVEGGRGGPTGTVLHALANPRLSEILSPQFAAELKSSISTSI
jgi:hypothetical protein